MKLPGFLSLGLKILHAQEESGLVGCTNIIMSMIGNKKEEGEEVANSCPS